MHNTQLNVKEDMTSTEKAMRHKTDVEANDSLGFIYFGLDVYFFLSGRHMITKVIV